MFSTYDLEHFSILLKNIRKSLNYTQNEVAISTGLSTETLRKLENGKTIPKYDTIEILSLFYKTDLHSVLNLCKSSTLIFNYYTSIDQLITNVNTKEIINTLSTFDLLINNNSFNLIEQKELTQLKYLIEGLKESYLYDEFSKTVSLNTSNELLISALKVFIPAFDILQWHNFKYNYLELRILFTMAANLGVLRKCDTSNDILKFVLDALNCTFSSNPLEKVLISRIYATISYNYHRLDQHQLAIDYANKGIIFCNEHGIMANLPLLLCRKGIAIRLLNQEGYEEFLDHAVILLKIQGNFEVASQYEQINARYRNK